MRLRRLQHWRNNRKARLPMRVRLFPIVIFEIYLNLTVLLFAYGPWAWPVTNPEKLYGFLLLAHAALLLGYLSAVNKEPRGYRGPLKLNTVIKTTVIVSLVWAIPGFYIGTSGVHGYSLSEIYHSASSGFSSLNEAYAAKVEVESLSAAEPSRLVRFSLVFLPITAMLLPLCVVFWDRLSWKFRIAFLFAMLVNACSWIAIGTTKGIADICMVMPWLALAAKPQILRKFSLRRLWKIAAVGLACLLIIYLFFSAAKAPSRRSRARVPTMAALNLRADADHPLLAVVPEGNRYELAQLCSYLTQGYYGLSVALDLDFVWCYGFGHSPWIAQAASRRFFHGDPYLILSRTYVGRSEDFSDWPAIGNWHSIYPYFASDVSFPGTIMLVFVLGHLFALSWLDVLRRENPFAVGVFALFVIMLFYFPGNNQVLGYYRGAIPFYVLFPIWLLTRRRVQRVSSMLKVKTR